MTSPKLHFSFIVLLIAYSFSTTAQERSNQFTWPEGKKVAVSLSFDDARLSQVDAGIPALDEYGVKATFYLNPAPMNERLEGWKKAASAGHEIGNHSLTHPCSGNFDWVPKGNELENFTLKLMRENISKASSEISRALGVKPTAFAYPCGQKYVGRGASLKSYVPLIGEMFASGRGWLEEMDNDPLFCDFAQLAGREMDGKSFEQIELLIKSARDRGDWVVLAGHEMGEEGSQTTSITMLRKLIEYANDPANGVWLAPVGTIQNYILTQRKK